MILFFYFSISIIRYLLTILLSYDLLHLFKILYFYFSHYAKILFMFLFKHYVITRSSFSSSLVLKYYFTSSRRCTHYRILISSICYSFNTSDSIVWKHFFMLKYRVTFTVRREYYIYTNRILMFD